MAEIEDKYSMTWTCNIDNIVGYIAICITIITIGAMIT